MSNQRQNITAMIYDRKGNIISIGKNSYIKTHPLQAKIAKKVGLSQKVFLHAEIAALCRLKDWSKAHRIVVTRFTADGQPANAAPCPICQEALRLAGIKVIDHT
jgi:tRNA(Arg) A34 adenosine deaminase TadA